MRGHALFQNGIFCFTTPMMETESTSLRKESIVCEGKGIAEIEYLLPMVR